MLEDGQVRWEGTGLSGTGLDYNRISKLLGINQVLLKLFSVSCTENSSIKDQV